MNIRTTKNHKGAVLYNAKDVYTSIDLSWRGKESLSNLKENKDFVLLTAPLQVSETTVVSVKHYAMTEKGVSKLCKLNKSKNPLNGITIKAASEVGIPKKVEKLEGQMKIFKGLLAGVLSREMQRAAVDNPPVRAILIPGDDPRVELRTLCANYAKRMAAHQRLTDREEVRTCYDLTYSLLYNLYKTKTNFDIKLEADKLNKSGLQIAEDYGIIDDLTDFAKTILV